MKMIAEDSQLVLIDFQEKLMPAIEHAEGVLEKAHVLAQAARSVASSSSSILPRSFLAIPYMKTARLPER